MYVANSNDEARSIRASVGNGHILVQLLDSSGTIRAIGRNHKKQLANGTTNNNGAFEANEAIATDLANFDVVQMVAGKDNSMFLLADGTVKCIGNNSSGQLGVGNTSDVSSLTDVPLDHRHTIGDNVGIGTLSPTEKLHVNGDVRADNVKVNGAVLTMSTDHTFKVTVADKVDHRYPPVSGSSSSSAYYIDGIESPFLQLVAGKTYKFDVSAVPSSHPLGLYASASGGSELTNPTFTLANDVHTMETSETTPATFFYMCGTHGYMGNQIHVAGGATGSGSGGGSGSGLTNWTEDSNGHIIPNTNATYDLGSAEKKVRHLYLSDNSIYMGTNTQISLDAENDITVKVGDNNATKLIKEDSSGKVPLSKLPIQEKNFKYKMLTGKTSLTVPGAPNDHSTNYTIGTGAVLFHDGTDNLEVTITPSSNSSQILISADIMGEFSGSSSAHHNGFFTLQKTQNGTSELIYPSTYNSYLASANINYHNDDNSTIDTGTFRYVDTLTSNSPVTYCVAIVTENTSNIYFNTNGCSLSDSHRNRERGLSIITAEELGGNAITSGLTNWTENSNGHFIPNTNATYDLGSAEKKVRHLYLSDNSIYMGTNTQISLDAENDITVKVGDNNATKLIKEDGSGKVPSSKLPIVPAASSGNLTSLQIGDTTYNIPSGGSGSNPDAFPSVTLPNDKQMQHKTLTGTQDISVTAGSSADFNDGTGALEVTLTPSVSSAQVLVTVNAKVELSNDTLLTLEKTVGTNAPTIVGDDHPFISNQCNFKFIDTLTDQTAVTYKTKVKNPSSQNVNVRLASTSALFDDNSFKFMWQAGKDKTVGIEYDVTAVGPTMSVSEDSDGYNYVSPQGGNYFKITDQGARLAYDQKNLTLAFVIDFGGDNTVGNFIFHQEGADNDSSGDARNHNFYINRYNGDHPNKLSYDNYQPGQGAYNSSSAISTGRNVVVVTLASTDVEIYENGVNTISGNKTSGDTYSGDSIDKILIGGSRYTNAHSFQSDKLYSVAVWQRALNATEAQSLTLDLLANKTGGPGKVSSIMTVEQISSARSFTTANPL